MCECKSTAQLQPLSVEKLLATIGRLKWNPSETSVLSGKMPTGEPLFVLGNKENFWTEFRGYAISGTCSHDKVGIHLSAEASRGGKIVGGFSVTVAIRNGSLGDAYGEIIGPIKITVSKGMKARNPVEDCIIRHAPDCFVLCCPGGDCSGECLLVCGAANA